MQTCWARSTDRVIVGKTEGGRYHMKKRRTADLGARIALPVLFLTVLLWMAAALALWRGAQAQMEWDFARISEETITSLAAVVPAETTEQDRPLTAAERAVLAMRAETLGISGVWVCAPEEESPALLWSSENTHQPLSADVKGAGTGALPWRLLPDDMGGWNLLCGLPLYGSDGAVTGRAVAVLSVTGQVLAARRGVLYSALALAFLAAAMAGVVLGLLHRSVTAPLARLAAAVCDGGAGETLAGLKLPGGVLSELAGSLRTVYEGMEERLCAARETAAQEARETTQMSLVGEINDSVLPQGLMEVPGRASFEVLGRVERGSQVSAYLYDYFFIDPGLLCVVIGDVPGHGVPAALFMVVAQTTIRSRLRKGRSLAETMADVNRQLYDLGNQLCFNALVGTLNVSDGRFSYVNAGQRQPLMMRNEDRYEWLESPIYAPLGMNENVSYRLEELRLKQGDRLFLYTAGFADLQNREGSAFGESRLRISLNLSRSRDLELGDLLTFASEEARAYLEESSLREGFALLALEYRKGEKELAHCDVPNQPVFAGAVADFLKHQFQENGIAKRFYAKTAVMVDEMFALCCRWATGEDTVMVECGVAPDAQMVTIRMTAVLGGVDPLSHAEDGVAGDAAEFIRGSADFVSFKAGEDRDTILMVSYLGE